MLRIRDGPGAKRKIREGRGAGGEIAGGDRERRRRDFLKAQC